ncbi:MAG: NAD(P)-binding protein [Rhodocyclales bacterium]|nr:NAD(P)-binding protein [Rhodocyclales bacterium]
MSTTNQTPQNTKFTYRRFKEGDTEYRRSQERLFKASWTYKCPTYVQQTPPCQGQCPAGEDIRSYLNIVRGIEKPPVGADGKPSMPWQEYAWRRLTECNPFPAIMGRVCPAPCQGGCNRAKVEEYVGINSVEQFLGNYAIEKGLGFAKPEVETGKKIAVIGGGVAGLSVAYQLRKKGHQITIFEAHSKLGGMLTFGLPAYRTPRDVVDAEVKRITDMGGIDVRCNTRVGKDVTMEQLRQDYDAVFIGIGAQAGNKLDIPGSDAPNVTDGITFLRGFNEGRIDCAGRHIVVIGGGDTAMDCAAVARRLGTICDAQREDENKTKVTIAAREGSSSVIKPLLKQSSEVVIAYRRHVQEMPASKHEIDAVIEEGVELQPCVAPVSVVKGADGKATALRVIKVDWVNKKMVPQEGSEYDIPADLIVCAVGQYIDWEGMDSFKNQKNVANVDKNLQAVGQPGVFVGGDAITPLLLTTAIGHARIAAEGIDQYVMTGEVQKRPKVDKKLFDMPANMTKFGVKFDKVPDGYTRATCDNKNAVHNFDDRADRAVIDAKDLFLGHFNHTPRNERSQHTVNADNVLGNMEERLIALTEAQAQAEAKRCMSCGMCFECDNCVIYCPQGAVKRMPKKEQIAGRYVTTDYFKCIGCHICMDVCPTGYIQMGLGGEGN